MTNLEKQESQCKVLASLFRKGYKISTAYAQKRLNITSFHRRLTDLKRSPWNMSFQSEWCEHDGVRCKRYSLAS